MRQRWLLFCLVTQLGLSSCGSGHKPMEGKTGPAEPLGHGYVRKGDFIHFEGGTASSMTSTRIDAPPKRVVRGFLLALKQPVPVARAPDAASFEPLSEEYSRDKNMVYYKWISPGVFLVVEMPEADVESFKVLNTYYAVDQNTIWYGDRPIPRSDPATARLVDTNVVADKHRVYDAGQAVPGVDAATFEHIGSGYFRDAEQVLWGIDPVEGADPVTFEVIEGSFFGRDKNGLYRSGEAMSHLDPETFTFILDDPYGYQVVSDKNGVYLNGLRFLHADPDDFRMIDNRVGRGGEYLFLVDTYHVTPLTVYRDGGTWIAETILYDRDTRVALAIMRGKLGASGMENVTLAPPPGLEKPHRVPQWQQDLFTRPDALQMIEDAQKHLEGEE